MIRRQYYLEQLAREKDRPIIKVITGMRRAGKSVLLFELFYDYLVLSGVRPSHIVKINLEDMANIQLREAKALYDFCVSKVKDKEKYYFLIDEIQYVEGFPDVVNSLNNMGCDVYITGSNSKLLSSDISTALRGRSINIHVMPLSFMEYFDYVGGSPRKALDDFLLYGGLPYVATLPDKESKVKYLKMIDETVATKDIIERHGIKNAGVLEALRNFLYSNIGAMVSVNKIAKTLSSTVGVKTTVDSLSNYLGFFEDAFLLYKVYRYDIKGKEYFKTLNKYYVADLGVRNAHLNFRQIEPTHALENLVYLELVKRGYSVDIGVNGEKEVDFVVNKGAETYYLQVAYSIADEEKRRTELASFRKIDDGYKKIVITMDGDPFTDLGNGYRKMNIFDFLLNLEALEEA